MKRVIIVEDETAAVVNLRSMLAAIEPEAQVVEVLESVEEAVEYFSKSVDADVVFMDIHLADGDSFRIFNSVDIDIPIIFTTAYDEYALEAFRKYGPLKGFWLSFKRIIRCHPWGGSGYDPVP